MGWPAAHRLTAFRLSRWRSPPARAGPAWHPQPDRFEQAIRAGSQSVHRAHSSRPTRSWRHGRPAARPAVDRHGQLRALVLGATAYRLGPTGRQAQQDQAGLTGSGARRQSGSDCDRDTAAAVAGPMLPAARTFMRSTAAADPSDMLVTLDARQTRSTLVSSRIGSAPPLWPSVAPSPLAARPIQAVLANVATAEVLNARSSWPGGCRRLSGERVA